MMELWAPTSTLLYGLQPAWHPSLTFLPGCLFSLILCFVDTRTFRLLELAAFAGHVPDAPNPSGFTPCTWQHLTSFTWQTPSHLLRVEVLSVISLFPNPLPLPLGKIVPEYLVHIFSMTPDWHLLFTSLILLLDHIAMPHAFFCTQIHWPFKNVIEKLYYNTSRQPVNVELSPYLPGIKHCFLRQLPVDCWTFPTYSLLWPLFFATVPSPEPWAQSFT